MSGTRIIDQQVRLYMNNRKHHPQKLAAAKSGMSERTARRVEHDAGQIMRALCGFGGLIP